jgi:FdhD protein
VLTTGRLSAEIVSKAVACRVPMLVSRSAVTALAVELARRFGLTLVGFLRGRRLNVYTGHERVGGPAGPAAGKAP